MFLKPTSIEIVQCVQLRKWIGASASSFLPFVFCRICLLSQHLNQTSRTINLKQSKDEVRLWVSRSTTRDSTQYCSMGLFAHLLGAFSRFHSCREFLWCQQTIWDLWCVVFQCHKYLPYLHAGPVADGHTYPPSLHSSTFSTTGRYSWCEIQHCRTAMKIDNLVSFRWAKFVSTVVLMLYLTPLSSTAVSERLPPREQGPFRTTPPEKHLQTTVSLPQWTPRMQLTTDDKQKPATLSGQRWTPHIVVLAIRSYDPLEPLPTIQFLSGRLSPQHSWKTHLLIDSLQTVAILWRTTASLTNGHMDTKLPSFTLNRYWRYVKSTLRVSELSFGGRMESFWLLSDVKYQSVCFIIIGWTCNTMLFHPTSKSRVFNGPKW